MGAGAAGFATHAAGGGGLATVGTALAGALGGHLLQEKLGGDKK